MYSLNSKACYSPAEGQLTFGDGLGEVGEVGTEAPQAATDDSHLRLLLALGEHLERRGERRGERGGGGGRGEGRGGGWRGGERGGRGGGEERREGRILFVSFSCQCYTGTCV